jgi:hypothetical protein
VERHNEEEVTVRRWGTRLLGLTTIFTVIGGVLAGTSFASGGPFMPCCFNPATGAAHGMACCIYNLAMQCCGWF